VSFPPIVEPLSPKATLALDPVAEMTLLDAPIRSYSVIAFRLTLIRHPRESVVSGQRRSGHAGSPLARECQSEAIVTVEGRNKAVTQLQGRALISMPPIFEALLPAHKIFLLYSFQLNLTSEVLVVVWIGIGRCYIFSVYPEREGQIASQLQSSAPEFAHRSSTARRHKEKTRRRRPAGFPSRDSGQNRKVNRLVIAFTSPFTLLTA
jgi:hypothetical protein